MRKSREAELQLAPAPAGPGVLCHQPTERGPGVVVTPFCAAGCCWCSWWNQERLAFGLGAGEGVGVGAGAASAVELAASFLWWWKDHQWAEALGTGPMALRSSTQQSPGSSLFMALPFPSFLAWGQGEAILYGRACLRGQLRQPGRQRTSENRKGAGDAAPFFGIVLRKYRR
jgi:hypothetical protein